ncbi:MAG: hypothetical protein A2521_10180 [Deltaproteobacteria bacterium RIFOXYD12_FULL_57_12]|nr:MAG: hypothetical protein A2521_10180 [Deltaproteobacteria bacterium RIFOXYD12_FULL_57_12]
MEQWDQDYIDLMGPGLLTVKADGDGELQFGAIEAWLDCRIETVSGLERREFFFDGMEEGDPICGRGWAQVKGKVMTGRLHFHKGDDSSFTATKAKLFS